MDKNLFATVPPMGWNSYDYYDTTVTEAQVKANADYMHAHLQEFGWKYIVVDIEWYSYDAGSQRKDFQYIPFWKVEMDEYSRLLPCPDRFPSSVNGQGFKPLADYIHSLGLKFGIHIMRGIPRAAAHNHTKILGTDRTANQIADPSNICQWNPDMYGVFPEKPGAQEYYDSLMQLYAQWGVDFIKCDDICRMDMASSKKEIEMLSRAIQKSGREIVFSLSPGPAKIEEAWHYEQYANMWRITDDFWDIWELLKAMFYRCELWQKHVSEGCYPDCDMLPLGYVCEAFGNGHYCGFTRAEQRTMMNLWCVFRSPLMLGTEMTRMDDWTLSLLQNRDLLNCQQQGGIPQQLQKDEQTAVWFNQNQETGEKYLALFNIGEEKRTIRLTLQDLAPLAKLAKEAAEQPSQLPEGHIFEIIDAWNELPAATAKMTDTLEYTLEPHASCFLILK